MSWIEGLGLFAGFMVTCSMIPQIIRVFKLRSAQEISLLFTTALLLGLIAWLVYGLYLGLLPLIIWNAIGTALAATLLYAKMKYGR